MIIQCAKLPAVPKVEVFSKGTERFNIVFQQYPVTYRLSDKRMKKYVEEKHAPRLAQVHQKRITEGRYEWRPMKTRKNKPLCLFDIVEQDWVIRNPKAAGTPKDAPISGQDFWSGGEQQQWNRMKLKEQLMDYFIPRIRTQLPESIWPPKGMFMQFEYIFYTNLDEYYITTDKKVQDLDNHAYPYMKIFKDTLQYMEIIKGDDPRYIRGSYPHYVHVDTEEERRLEIKIHFCHNDQAIHRPIWAQPNSDVVEDSDELDPL